MFLRDPIYQWIEISISGKENLSMLLNIKFMADWEMIRLGKQKDVDRNNDRENSLRVDHDYHIGDKVLVTDNDIQCKLNCPTKEPYNIIQVYTNGTVRVQRGAVTERINIHHCTLYTEPHQFGGSAVGPVYPVLNNIN